MRSIRLDSAVCAAAVKMESADGWVVLDPAGAEILQEANNEESTIRIIPWKQ